MVEPDHAPKSGPAGRDLLTLQYLRAIAAMAVVYAHIIPNALGFMGFGRHSASEFGAWGVDLFFVISGFIMFYISASRQPSPGKFFTARILRVGPLYWLVTLAMFFMPLISRTIGWSSSLDPRQLATSVAFIGGVHWPHSVGTYPVYRPGWTINYEIFFYVLFSIGLFIRPIARSAIFVSVLLTALVLGGILLAPTNEIARFYTAPIMLEFMLGMAVAYAYLAGHRAPWPLAAALIATGFGVLIRWADISGSMQLTFRGLSATAIVFGAISLERIAVDRPLRLPKLLGDASYSIYLTHVFTLSALEMAWLRISHRLNISLNVWMLPEYVVAWMVVSAAIGVAVYMFIEKPFHQWTRRLTGKRSKTGDAGRVLPASPAATFPD